MASQEEFRSNLEEAIERLREQGIDEELLTKLKQMIDRGERLDIAQVESLIFRALQAKARVIMSSVDRSDPASS